MIRYSLQCENGHEFESWFASSDAYDKQVKRKLVSCPACGSAKVEKAIMAPRLARTDKLARLGLSKPKIRTVKEIGHAISRKHIDLDAVAAMEADQAHAALTALHGIGPWTADIYLLFCLGNADAWPAGDLALQEAARLAFDLKQRPDAKAMAKLGEKWRPWRGVAAHLLWAYYHVVKRREGAPVQQTWPAVTAKKKAKRPNHGR